MEFLRTKIEDWFRSQNHAQPTTPRLLIVVMILAAGLVWFCTRGGSEAAHAADLDERSTADTFVPAGFVLVPIEIENYQALESLLGQQGVVDLYTSPSQPGERVRKVASRIKILRAPLNPSSFAVLAKSEDAAQLVHTGRFFVVVKNPRETGTEIEKTESGKHAQPASRLIVETIE